MKFFLILAVVVAGVLAEEMYTNKYDNINIDDILRNKKLLNAYNQCLLDVKPCKLAEMRYLREHVPEAIENDCAKCTPKQKESTEKIIKHLMKHEPATWSKLQDKYDPKRIYTKKYEDAGVI